MRETTGCDGIRAAAAAVGGHDANLAASVLDGDSGLVDPESVVATSGRIQFPRLPEAYPHQQREGHKRGQDKDSSDVTFSLVQTEEMVNE